MDKGMGMHKSSKNRGLQVVVDCCEKSECEIAEAAAVNVVEGC